MVKDHSDSERKPAAATGYSFQLTARVLLYAPSHRQDSTYHSLCYTSCGAQAGTRNSSMVHPMKDRSDDPSHHEQTLLPRSYILLLIHHEDERNFEKYSDKTNCIFFSIFGHILQLQHSIQKPRY